MMQSRSHGMFEQASDSDDRSRLSDPRNQGRYPLVDFLFLLLLLFAVEALVMLALATLPKMSRFFETIVDSLVLSLILAPFLWRVVVVPLRQAARFRGLVEQSLVGIYIIDGERLLYTNPRVEAIWGCGPSGLAGVSLKALVADDDWPATEREIRRLVSGEVPVAKFEFRGRRKDGQDVMIGAQGLRTHIDGRQAIIGVMQDITERKKAAEALTLFRTLIDQSNDAIEVLDPETGRVLDVNEKACLDLGYSRAELLALRISDLDPMVDHSSFTRLGEELRTSGILLREGLHRRKNGSTFPVEVNIKYVPLDRDYMVTVVRDITERKQTEAVVRTSEARYRSLFEDSHDAIYLTTREGLFVDVNPAMLALLGYTRTEMVELPVLEIYVNPADRERFQQVIEQQGSVRDYAVQFKKKDGTVLDCVLTATVRRNQEDHIVGYQGIIRDITAQKQAAVEKDLLEAELRQAQKMEAIGQLAGGVAHDFNNLLTVILGYSTMFQQSLDAHDPRRQDVDEVLQAGEQTVALTRQLLAFSRKQILQPEDLNLNPLIADSLKMIRRLLGEDIEVHTVFEPTLGRVKVDPGQVEQVLLNLVVNARDAMPQGGKLTIETANVELDDAYAHVHVGVRSGSYVRVAISDTGCGMPPEVQAHIFEPFFTTKGPGQGTGLGLATVYGIVTQSGGHLSVYSEVDIGTVFQIYLPRLEASPTDLPEAAQTSALPEGTETILLVEDETNVRIFTGDLLRKLGYTVVLAANGEHALQVSERHGGPIHLLITDVVMPQMGGRVLADQFRARSPETKVLYVSGYTDDAIVRHGILTTGVAFLQKPFTPVVLAHKVRAVLDGLRPDA